MDAASTVMVGRGERDERWGIEEAVMGDVRLSRAPVHTGARCGRPCWREGAQCRCRRALLPLFPLITPPTTFLAPSHTTRPPSLNHGTWDAERAKVEEHGLTRCCTLRHCSLTQVNLLMPAPRRLRAHALPHNDAEYKEAFALFDKKGTGHIARESLGDLLRALGPNPTQAEVAELAGGAPKDSA